MEPLILKKTESTPAIILNPKAGKFQLVGRSWPEDAKGFYQQVIDWFHQYFKNTPLPVTTVEIRIKYYNTATQKQLGKLLLVLRSYEQKNFKVRFKWYYIEDDLESIHEINRFEKLFGLKIEKVPLADEKYAE